MLLLNGIIVGIKNNVFEKDIIISVLYPIVLPFPTLFDIGLQSDYFTDFLFIFFTDDVIKLQISLGRNIFMYLKFLKIKTNSFTYNFQAKWIQEVNQMILSESRKSILAIKHRSFLFLSRNIK
jgi:hypothetical protein